MMDIIRYINGGIGSSQLLTTYDVLRGYFLSGHSVLYIAKLRQLD